MAKKDTPGIGHNGGPPIEDDSDDFLSRMPDDSAGALKFSWLHYKRLMEHRKFLAETRSASAKDIAAAHDVKPALIKLGFRMARMTPEKRIAYADAQNKVLGLFGYSPAGAEDIECTNEELRKALEVDKWVFEQQQTTNKAMKDLQQLAKARGVDWAAMAAVYRLNRAATSANGNSDAEEVSDTPAAYFFDRMDAVGRFVGVWQS